MKEQIHMRIVWCIAPLVVAILGNQLSWAGGETCVTGSQVKVCLQWSQAPDPIEDVDFSVSFADPTCPGLQLKKGDLAWIVSSELVGTGAPANISSITTPVADNFVVKIAKVTGAGAANVGSIALQPTGNHYSSVAAGSIIAGDLTGNLTVLRDSGGTGGEASIAINGSVQSSSTITVPVLKALTIAGDVDGDVNVTTALADGTLSAAGSVGSSCVIDVVDMTGASFVTFDGAGAGTKSFAGRLNIHSGVKAKQALSIGIPLTSSGIVDFDGGDIEAGILIEAGAGAVINAGTLTDNFEMANVYEFTGSVTIADIGESGALNWECVTGVHMNGTIHVTGDVEAKGFVGAHSGIMLSNSQIVIDGNLAGAVGSSPAGDGGDFPGVLTVGGNVSGTVAINGNLGGSVAIDGAVSGDIKVTGNVSGSVAIDESLTSTGRILIDGLCNGGITIGRETASLSLIRATQGLGSSGAIRINDSRGDYDARGVIQLGTTASIIPTPPPNVSFDGSIKILRNAGNTDGGDLIGGITVIGCHATSADLDICICGTNSGRVSIDQAQCTNQVSWSCVSGCN